MKKVIIVGGGTAGAVVAKKLSSHFDVILFDKGNKKNMPYMYRIPLLLGLLFSRETSYVNKSNLIFNKERLVPFFEPGLIGGTSIINGCVHVAGHVSAWSIILKKFKLSLDDLYESYNELFTKTQEKGKINISQAKQSRLEAIFFSALKLIGVDRGDVEWTNNIASGLIYNTVKRYFRSSILDLDPFSKTKVIGYRKVERLVVNANSAIIGVFDGRDVFHADYIILCAGVIGTNTILLREAIRVDDKSLVDLEINAGRCIKDHTNLRVNVEASTNINSLNEINSNFFQKIKLAFCYALGMNTLMRGTGATATVNLDINEDGEVDTRVNLLRFYETERMGSDGRLFSNSSPGFSVSITHINPKSSGSITLSPGGINIRPNYLTESSDIDHLKKSLGFVIKLIETEPFRRIIKKIENIDLIKQNPEKYILDNSYSGYHLIGGCAHLISENFNVDNHKNLFISDASIFSEYPSSNIHSSVVIMADLFVKKFNQLTRVSMV